MGRIYRRGDTWHAYWHDAAGAAHRTTLRTTDKSVARARLRRLELASTDPAAHSAHTLGEAIDGLQRAMIGAPAGTIDCYDDRARHLLRLLGDTTQLGSLSRDTTMRYVADRIGEGAHPSTVAKEAVVLRRALTEARARKVWDGDPRAIVPAIKTHYTPRERWLTRTEAASLLSVLPPRRALWAAIAIFAGLRHSEVEALQWEHVDLARGILRAPGKKTKGAWRRIPIAAELAMMIAPLDAGTGPVVEPWPNVRRDLHVAMTTVIEGGPRKRRGGDEAKVPRRTPAAAKISPNDLRRTFASWLVQSGVPHLVVAHLLGHSTTRMVELVYGKLSEDTYRDAIDALNRHCAAGVQEPMTKSPIQAPQSSAPIDENANRSAEVFVPRDGVEPPTRGFSVRGLVVPFRKKVG